MAIIALDFVDILGPEPRRNRADLLFCIYVLYYEYPEQYHRDIHDPHLYPDHAYLV